MPSLRWYSSGRSGLLLFERNAELCLELVGYLVRKLLQLVMVGMDRSLVQFNRIGICDAHQCIDHGVGVGHLGS
jgi:hypothetical protein